MKLPLHCFLLVIIFCPVFSQSKTDSLDLLKCKEKILALYDQSMQGTLHLYNGSDYVEYDALHEEHPYYLTDEWTYSEVKYDGDWYHNIPILFDIQRGKLIAYNYHNGTTMQLVDDLVQEFNMRDHRFVNIKELSENLIPKCEYYEVVYDGKTKVLVQRTKVFSRKLDVSEEFRTFFELNQVLLYVNDQLAHIDSKRDVLDLFRVKKKEVRDYINANRLFKGNNDKEFSLVRVAEYFDSINP